MKKIEIVSENIHQHVARFATKHNIHSIEWGDNKATIIYY